jgi:hypothetical protein
MTVVFQGYETIFALGPSSFPWAHLLHPGIAMIIGVPLFLFGRNEWCRLAGGVAAIFGALLLVISAIVLVPQYVSLRHAYLKGESSVLEGAVEDFHPAPRLGPATESFTVNGTVFTYNALDSTPCFHDAPFRRGPIRPGLKIRIFYHGQCIQRIDVRR